MCVISANVIFHNLLVLAIVSQTHARVSSRNCDLLHLVHFGTARGNLSLNVAHINMYVLYRETSCRYQLSAFELNFLTTADYTTTTI